ncbi:MAG: hypothetical protein ACXIUZ_02560 [Lysobacteraceae bacterium]
MAGLAALMACGIAQAQTLYKCVDRSDAVTIQSDPCPAGSRTEWTREVHPNLQRGNAPARPAASPSPQPAHRSPVTTYTPPRAPSAAEQRRSRCEAARRTAAAERDRYWRTITFERRRQLDDWVRAQCR